MLRNWIITCQAAATFSPSALRCSIGRHAYDAPPQRLGAYLAILIAQQKCSMGQGARQLGRERQTRTGAHRVRLERRKRAKMLAHVPFQRLFERCVMCFRDAASSTHSEKEAPLDHLVSPLYLFHFMFFFLLFFPSLKSWGEKFNECQS